MKRNHALILRSLALVVGLSTLFFNLIGCGGGSSPTVQQPQDAAAPDDSAGQGAPERNVLTTNMPALGTLSAGAQFDFVIRGEFVDELFQGSGRVLYDPSLVEPLKAERGAFIPSSNVFMARCNLAAGTLASPEPQLSGVIPFAFTGLPGERGHTAGRGELLRVRFRLLARPQAGAAVHLQNDMEYLQLRDAQGRRLSFDFASEEVSR